MDTLETERAAAQAILSAPPLPDEIPLHPGLATVYARKVGELATSLNEEGTRDEAVSLLRGLIEKVILHPDENAPNGHAIELYGELGAILSLCGGGLSANAKTHAGGVGFKQLTMVAGARSRRQLPGISCTV